VRAIPGPMRSVAFGFVTSLELPPDRAAAAKARHFVGETMQAWNFDDVIPDAELLVSELVTNAVLHARSTSRVTIEHNGTTLRVSVSDTSPTRPRLRNYGPEAVTGRGLLLVDRISRRWGVEQLPTGKTVWFEIDTTPASDHEIESNAH
jgi:anti-sigma regulatory factor (Ser/Thr protein kinase)